MSSFFAMFSKKKEKTEPPNEDPNSSQNNETEKKSEKKTFAFIKSKKLQSTQKNDSAIDDLQGSTNEQTSLPYKAPQIGEQNKSTPSFLKKSKKSSQQSPPAKKDLEKEKANISETNPPISIENFLDENQNILSSTINREDNDISMNDSVKEDYNNINEYQDFSNISNNRQTENRQGVSQVSENNKEKSKDKGFSFLKKKPKEEKQLEENEKSKLNYDDDTKSLKSLKINNNFINDNISVNLEEDLKDKSVNLTHSNFQIGRKESHPKINTQTTSSQKLTGTENSAFLSKDPETIKNQCYEKIKKNEENLKDLVVKINTFKESLKKKQDNLKELEKKVTDFTTKEDEAIEENDFDKAENIENEIKSFRGRIQKVVNEINKDKKELIEFREEEILLLRQKTKILEEASNSFIDLKKKEEKEFEKFQNTEVNKHKNDLFKKKTMKDKLEFLKNNLESSKLEIDEEEQKITNLVKSQSTETFEQLEDLNKNKEVLNSEIEELKKALENKYNELESLNREIDIKESEIDAIKSTFSHEFNKINKKKKNYEESLKDFTEQEETFNNMTNVYEQDEIKIDEKDRKLRDSIDQLEKESTQFKAKVNSISENLVRKEGLLKEEEKILSNIHLIQMRYDKNVSSREKNLENIQHLEISIKRVESDIVAIDMKIPSLEGEKKSFVSMKSFKEAGRVSNELKKLNENKTQNLNTIEEHKSRIHEIKMENEKLSCEMNKIEKEKEEEAKRLNTVRYEYLIAYMEEVKELFDKVKDTNDQFREFHFQRELDNIESDLSSLKELDYIKKSFPSNEENYISSQQEKTEIMENQQEQSEKLKEEGQPSQPEEKYEKGNNEEDENESLADVDKEALKERYQNLNNSLERCIEREDFEKADELQNEIDKLAEQLEGNTD